MREAWAWAAELTFPSDKGSTGVVISHPVTQRGTEGWAASTGSGGGERGGPIRLDCRGWWGGGRAVLVVSRCQTGLKARFNSFTVSFGPLSHLASLSPANLSHPTPHLLHTVVPQTVLHPRTAKVLSILRSPLKLLLYNHRKGCSALKAPLLAIQREFDFPRVYYLLLPNFFFLLSQSCSLCNCIWGAALCLLGSPQSRFHVL